MFGERKHVQISCRKKCMPFFSVGREESVLFYGLIFFWFNILCFLHFFMLPIQKHLKTINPKTSTHIKHLKIDVGQTQ